MAAFNSRSARSWSRLGIAGAFHGIGLIEARKADDRIAVTVADTYRPLGLERFKKMYPESFFNMGIAEQNMIGMSAGMASEGYKVFSSTYASFATGRAYEFVRQNLGVSGCNVKIVGCFSGVATGMSGYSHWSVDDIALMRAIPGMTVLCPADAFEAVKMAEACTYLDAPAYIKVCGSTDSPIVYSEDYRFEIGKAVKLYEGTDAALIASGPLVSEAMAAASLLEQEGISCSVYNFHTIKPLDAQTVENICRSVPLVISVEEHSIVGGLGAAFVEHAARLGNTPRHIFMGIDDIYRQTGSRRFVLEQYGLTVENIAQTVRTNIDAINKD